MGGLQDSYKKAAEKLRAVAEDEELDANETMKKVDAIEEKIRFKAFGKQSKKQRRKNLQRLFSMLKVYLKTNKEGWKRKFSE